MALLDANGRPLGNPTRKGDPAQEVYKIIRMMESGLRKDTADVCACIEAAAKAGWKLTVDDTMPESSCEATIIMHLKLAPTGEMKPLHERWLRLGKKFTEAMNVVKSENQKALNS